MVLTIDKLLHDANSVRAIIDRAFQQRLDTIYWRRYLTFEQTQSRAFKTYIGTVSGVTAGSIIDRNSNKPIRQRHSLGQGLGEVAILGDKYQLDNDRLDMLQSLIDKFNQRTVQDKAAMNEIVDYIIDDFRQVLLAPNKRMDLVVGDLRSLGKATVNLDNNPEGVTLLDINLPVKELIPTVGDTVNFITYLKDQIEGLRTTIGRFAVMEMSRKTFNNFILASQEFQGAFKLVFSNARVATAAGLITPEMVNEYFTGIGLPRIRIIDEYVAQPDGTNKPTFADNRITLLTGDNLGRMMWHTPYEAIDPIPTKTYTFAEGGMYISNIRTDEGRFIEYGCEWIPNFTAPNKIAIVNLDSVVNAVNANVLTAPKPKIKGKDAE